MDILAAHGDPRTSGTGVDLGNGLVAERRPVRKFRPRRGPEAGSRPFDAQGTMVRDRDSGRPVATWSTISLIKVLEEELSHSPIDAEPSRSTRIEDCWRELERRGHNVQGYVRWGLGQFIATSVVIATVLPDLEHADDDNESEESTSHSGRLREAPAGWANLLDQMPNRDPSLERVFASKGSPLGDLAVCHEYRRAARTHLRTLCQLGQHTGLVDRVELGYATDMT